MRGDDVQFQRQGGSSMEPMQPMEPMRPMKPMEPMKPLDFGEAWWPETLGRPATSGAQNGLRYAVFPELRRLVVEDHARLTTYDTADHRIGGVSQQQSDGASLAFMSQHGAVRLDDLAVMEGGGDVRRRSSSAQTAASDGPAPRRTETAAGSQMRSAEERIVFSEGGNDGASIKVLVLGLLDEDLLDALEDFVGRQRKRLAKTR